MIKKKLLVSLSTAALVGSLLATAAGAKEDNGKKSLVALGDSITFGYNLENNNNHVSREAFPFIIGKNASLRVRDLGEPGWTTDQLLSALQNDEKFQQAVQHADYVTVDIGSNDLLRAFQDGIVTSGEVAIMLNHLTDIILTVRSLTDKPIVVYNIYNPFQVVDSRHAIGDYLLSGINGNGINGQIAGLIGQLPINNVVLADAYTAFDQNQAIYVQVGDVHPTVEGQKKLAEIGLKALNLE